MIYIIYFTFLKSIVTWTKKTVTVHTSGRILVIIQMDVGLDGFLYYFVWLDELRSYLIGLYKICLSSGIQEMISKYWMKGLDVFEFLFSDLQIHGLLQMMNHKSLFNYQIVAYRFF